MTIQHAVDTAQAFRDSVMAGPKLLGATAAAVFSAFWKSFSSMLAWVLAILFFADLFLGVLRAVHRGGLDAFDWERFWRAWIKLGAAMVGVTLFTAGDLLLHQSGVPQDWYPLSSAALMAMSWGFLWSATQSFGYFFPGAQEAVEKVLHRLRAPGDPHPNRRATDPPN